MAVLSLLTSCVALGKSPDLSEPQVLPLQNAHEIQNSTQPVLKQWWLVSSSLDS